MGKPHLGTYRALYAEDNGTYDLPHAQRSNSRTLKHADGGLRDVCCAGEYRKRRRVEDAVEGSATKNAVADFPEPELNVLWKAD